MHVEKQRVNTPIHVMDLIGQFSHIFVEPSQLPSTRTFDHQISLKPGSQPVTIWLFRHSHGQKTEIEQQVKEMLSQGIIRPRRSPYASPVLLVKKEDETKSMCIDYRRLNEITVKDKSPRPIIEDLLDELHGTTVFTNLDHRWGYH